MLAFVTSYKDQQILVVANLSRFPEYAELDLTPWKGMSLLELFGQNTFPTIDNRPYFLSLAPYLFYWFLLQPPTVATASDLQIKKDLPVLSITNGWEMILKNASKSKFEAILPHYLSQQRWFGKKSQQIKEAKIIEIIPINNGPEKIYLLLIESIDIREWQDLYFLPITFLKMEAAVEFQSQYPHALIAKLSNQEGYLLDACYLTEFPLRIIKYIAHSQKIKGQRGTLVAQHTSAFRSLYPAVPIKPLPLKGEQSNTSIVCDNTFVLKCFRHCEMGINPDFEISEFLTEQAHFPHSPALAGSLQYHTKQNQVVSLALLHQFIPHETDGWQYTLDSINRFFEHILAGSNKELLKKFSLPTSEHLINPDLGIPMEVQTLLSNYIQSIQLLGQRTGELHIALTTNGNADFAPEPFSTLQQRAVYQSIRTLMGRTFTQLSKNLTNLPADVQVYADKVLQSGQAIQSHLHKLIEHKLTGLRIRCHGDFHLGQVLYTGKDFILVDFEGEPARAISERRIKRSPLFDIAGMLRSFNYAAQTALFGQTRVIREEDIKILEHWAHFWEKWVGVAFLQGYLLTVRHQEFLPQTHTDFKIFLEAMLLEKAIYEINYELNNRPDWLFIPCRGLIELLCCGN